MIKVKGGILPEEKTHSVYIHDLTELNEHY